MRYSYVLQFPDNVPPFDRSEESRWNSFLGEFVVPIACKFPDLEFWCTNYNSEAKFRVVSEDQTVHDFIDGRIKASGLIFDPNKEATVTVLSDLGASRFLDQNLGKDAVEKDEIKKRRSMLTLRFLCSLVRLHLDSLVNKGGGYWDYQPTPDQQNPLGNNFESLVHLVGNITRFEFDVYVTAGTAWQPPKPPLAPIRTRVW